MSSCLTMGMTRCARPLCVHSLAQGHLRHPPFYSVQPENATAMAQRGEFSPGNKEHWRLIQSHRMPLPLLVSPSPIPACACQACRSEQCCTLTSAHDGDILAGHSAPRDGQGQCGGTSPVSSRGGSGEYWCCDRSGYSQDTSLLGLQMKEPGQILTPK